MVRGLFHYNESMPHQVDHARAFAACGFKTTTDTRTESGLHVISGPHYAYNWLGHPNVLMIDRAWWGDPGNVSLGWLQPDGSRKFASGERKRPYPWCHEWKTREWSCLILADYGQDVTEIEYKAAQRFGKVRIRKHPADQDSPTQSLHSDLMLSDVCIGTSGTSIFEAITLGVPSICLDEANACMPVCSGLEDELYRGDRSAWLHDMSYKQFSLYDIETGAAWELLREGRI